MRSRRSIREWAELATLVAALVVGTWLVLNVDDRLDQIEDHMADQGRSSDARFKMRADEHRGITQDINRVLAALALSIAEHTHECE